MSEEKTPKKKAARKSSARKKSVSKKAAPQDAAESKASSIDQEQSLPLIPDAPSSEALSKEQKPKKERKPKSGVRDVRKDPSAEDKGGEDQSQDNSESKSQANDHKSKSESSDDDSAEERTEGRRRGGRNRGRRGGNEASKHRPPVDGKDLKKKAWKIYLSEVTEEGLALLDDQALRAYARGSFNAARIYLEEELKVD